jgi:hypothetical protein
MGTTLSVMPFAQHLPGHDVGVVLHVRDDHLVPFPEEGPAVGGGDQVDGLGGAPGEDDLVVAAGVDEAGDLLAPGLEAVGGPLAQVVQAPVDVGVIGLVGLAHGVDDLARFLGTGRVVEVDQRPPVDRLLQDREVGAHPFHVEGRHGVVARRHLNHVRRLGHLFFFLVKHAA